MFKVLRKSALIAAMMAGCVTPVIAQKTCQSDGFGGVRCSDGGGWQSDGFGGQRGTGNNSGKTCTSDGFGGMRCN